MSISGYSPAFKERRRFELRVKDVQEVRNQHPDKVPLIVERFEGEKYLPLLDRCKFLVPQHITIAELMHILRRRLQLHPDQTLFLLINEKSMVSNTLTLQQVYADEQDQDGFLYIVYTSQPTFGKSSAGYNLTNLFIGSEGTLGIITEATLKLHAIPEMITSAVCSFEDIAGAVTTVTQILQCAIPMARLELLDEVQMSACDQYSHLDYKVAPTLFLEFHGRSENELKDQTDFVETLCQTNGGSDFRWSNLPEERSVLWKARHDVLYAALALRPGSKPLVTDVCVPISELTGVLLKTKADIESSPLIGCIVGHVGDGNFHVIFPIMPGDKKELTEAVRLSNAIAHHALSSRGTCTGEHGIGMGKMELLRTELGPETVEVMRQIKKVLDPNDVMNPGKIF